MEVEKINQKHNEEIHRNVTSCYLLDGANTWVSENNLKTLNSSIVKKYFCSKSKKLRIFDKLQEDVQQKVDVDGKERIISIDNIKQECPVDLSGGRHQVYTFCNILSPLLNDETVDGTKKCDSSNKKVTHPNDKNDLPCKSQKANQTDNKPFSCNVCDKRFRRSHHLKYHQLIHTGEKPFSCDICGKRFKQNSHLKPHQLIHTGDKPFECNVCDKRFRQNSTLKYHQLIHTGNKPFLCNVCDQRFGLRSKLNTHLLIHTGEKPFACNVCGKRFGRSCHLMSHQLTHTGEKPFACNVCGKRFGRSSHLKSHQLTHTGEKPFSCDICYKRFVRRSTLKDHQSTHINDTG